MKTLLDTNVLSELMKPLPDTNVMDWISGKGIDTLYTSTITEAEGLYGLGIMPEGKRRDLKMRVFKTLLDRLFPRRIIAFGRKEAICYADIMVTRRRLGRPVSQNDAMIASVAKIHDMTIATRNIKDFELLNITLINPFEV